MLWSVHSFCVVLLKEYNLLPLEHTDIHYAQSLVYCFLSQPQLTAQYSCAHPAAFFWLILLPAPFCISCPLHCCCFLLLQTFASCCAAFSFYRLTCSSAAPAAHQMQALLSNVRTSVKPIVFTTLLSTVCRQLYLKVSSVQAHWPNSFGVYLTRHRNHYAASAHPPPVRPRTCWFAATCFRPTRSGLQRLCDGSLASVQCWHSHMAFLIRLIDRSTKSRQLLLLLHMSWPTFLHRPPPHRDASFCSRLSTWTRCRDPPRLTCWLLNEPLGAQSLPSGLAGTAVCTKIVLLRVAPCASGLPSWALLPPRQPSHPYPQVKP